MKIVVGFDNLGPYHVARLNHLSRVCNLSVIQFRERSHDYIWDFDTKPVFDTHTVLGSDHPDWNAPLYEKINRILDKLNPDVIAIPGWASYFAHLLLRWATSNKVPTILMSDSQEIDYPRWSATEWIKSRLIKEFSSALVAGTRQRKYLIDLGFDGCRISDGYDVVDNYYFSMRSDEARRHQRSLRASYGLPERYIICSARFLQRKNLLHLVESYSLLIGHSAARTDHKPDRHLVIIGDGPMRDEIRGRVATLELVDRVHLPGLIKYSEIPVFYALADYFILPSTSDQWGLVVNEAMACGLPVIVSDRCGCVEDLVLDGVNGYTFNPDVESDLLEAMLRLEAMPDSLSRMGVEGNQI